MFSEARGSPSICSAFRTRPTTRIAARLTSSRPACMPSFENPIDRPVGCAVLIAPNGRDNAEQHELLNHAVCRLPGRDGRAFRTLGRGSGRSHRDASSCRPRTRRPERGRADRPALTHVIGELRFMGLSNFPPTTGMCCYWNEGAQDLGVLDTHFNPDRARQAFGVV